MEQELTVSIILYTFPKMQALRPFPSDSDLPHILHHIFCKLPAELMLEIFSLVLYLFMT